ncbi:MAG: hypothetical protein IKT35_04555, partial [Clostridia bacterium]|nr:hypothetical protein [Clostridia bacterium]
RNAKKAIKNIRSQNENSGDKIYKTSYVNRERGKITGKISPSGNLENQSSGGLYGAMGTVKISTQELPQNEGTSVLANNETTVIGAEGTTVLNVAGDVGTTVLNNANGVETTVLNTANVVETTALNGPGDVGTTVLNAAEGMGTTVLNDANAVGTTVLNAVGNVGSTVPNVGTATTFQVEYEITYVHSSETIV